MDLRSLGLRSVMIFHRFEGEVEDRGEYLVIRTPSNPTYRWGNYLLFSGPPRIGDLGEWERLFRSELGDLAHRVFAWDMPEEGSNDEKALLGDIEPFREAGYRVERDVVLTAREVRDPPRVNEEVEVRPLASDAEWQEAVALGVLCRDPRNSERGYAEYLTPKMASYRRMQELGMGSWFGAFLDGRLVADLGVFRQGEIARYQSVKTHPDFRRRGICGTAVAEVGRYALGELGARRLVMLADPGYHAAAIYESVGFAPAETIAGVEKF